MCDHRTTVLNFEPNTQDFSVVSQRQSETGKTSPPNVSHLANLFQHYLESLIFFRGIFLNKLDAS